MFVRLVLLAGALSAASCAAAPFGFAEDRCLGAYNQCQNSCASVGEGPARAACSDRCMNQENRCYGSGDDSASSLAVDRAVGEAARRRSKEEDFQRWKARKAKDAAKADTESALQ